MDIKDFSDELRRKMQAIDDYLNSDLLKEEIGTAAVAIYKQNFVEEGFMDDTLEPWSEVERRKPHSPWYGWSGQRGKRTPSRLPDEAQTGLPQDADPLCRGSKTASPYIRRPNQYRNKNFSVLICK